MDVSHLTQDCQRFSLTMGDRIDENDVLKILEAGYPASLDNQDSPGIFRTGYLAGAHDAYHEITPKLEQIGNVLHEVYKTLNELSAKQDNVEFLQDLAAARSHIVGYLVAESDDIRASTLHKLAERYCIAEKVMDLSIHLSDMPRDVFTMIGRAEAKKNPRQFVVFYVTNGKMETPESPTIDELKGRTDLNTRLPSELDATEFEALSHRYGMFLVQHARKLYKELNDVLKGYQTAHEADSASLAGALMVNMRAYLRRSR